MSTAVEAGTQILRLQLNTLVSSQFPKALGETAEQYCAGIEPLIEDAEYSPDDCLSLVDPRIPFESQLLLLGIKLDPAVYNRPHAESTKPYVARLRLIDPHDPLIPGYTFEERVNGLPTDLRPATPFEGIINYMKLLQTSFYAMPGGVFKRHEGLYFGPEYDQRILVLDRFLGNPRLTQLHKKTRGDLTGILAAVRS